GRAAHEDGEEGRLGQHQAADELGPSDAQPEADESAPRMADEVHRREAELVDEGGQVLDVLAHLVGGFGPGSSHVEVAARVCEHAVARRQRVELPLPRPAVAQAAVDQNDGVPGPALRVIEATIVFGLRLHAAYPSPGRALSLMGASTEPPASPMNPSRE